MLSMPSFCSVVYDILVYSYCSGGHVFTPSAQEAAVQDASVAAELPATGEPVQV